MIDLGRPHAAPWLIEIDLSSNEQRVRFTEAIRAIVVREPLAQE